MILERIRSSYPQLTKNQKRLADFVATSYREAAFMTASRLARQLGLNEATVIRFAQRLGYPGYRQFSEDVQAIVQEELQARHELEDAVDLKAPLLHVLDNELQALHYAASHVPSDLAKEVHTMLSSARRVCVLGQGESSPLAQLLALGLRSVGLRAEALPADCTGMATSLADVDDHCAVVGIAAVAESMEVAGALRFARQAGARTLALAWSPISAVAQAADAALSCPMGDLLPLPSVAAIAVLIDALVQDLGVAEAERTRAHTQKVSQAREFVSMRRRK